MKIFAILAALTVAGAVYAAPNFNQSPTTGDNAWGPINSLNFEDDLIIDSGTWNVNQITTYEYQGQFAVNPSYTLNIYDNYTDAGGNLLHTYSSTNFTQDGSLLYGGVDVNFNTAGLTLGPGTYIIQFAGSDPASDTFYWYNADLRAVNGQEEHLDGSGGSSNWSAGNESFDASWNIQATAAPEPGTIAALGLGILGIVRLRRKKA